MDTAELDLTKWVLEFSGKYCEKCEDNCCNGIRQLINIGLSETRAVELFRKKGLPIYRLEELDDISVVEWLSDGMVRGLFEQSGCHFIGYVNFKDGRKVEKPAIIETPQIRICSKEEIRFGKGRTYVLYVDKFCPFYKAGRGCEVYGNPNRPDACKSYPLNVEKGKDKLRVTFHKWCPSSLEGLADIQKKFPDVDVSRV